MAQLLRVFPYADDELNLPVRSVADALPFYKKVFRFEVLKQTDKPIARAVLSRDGLRIGLAENGGDPNQEGCFFEVDDVEAAYDELRANGLEQPEPNFRVDQHGETTYKVFFVIAPDELCYCLGQRQS